MSTYDDHSNGYWDYYDHYDEDVEDSKTCKFCNCGDLHWGHHKGGWRLFDGDGELHICKTDPVDEFEPIGLSDEEKMRLIQISKSFQSNPKLVFSKIKSLVGPSRLAEAVEYLEETLS
jgi:hypothetical protein